MLLSFEYEVQPDRMWIKQQAHLKLEHHLFDEPHKHVLTDSQKGLSVSKFLINLSHTRVSHN